LSLKYEPASEPQVEVAAIKCYKNDGPASLWVDTTKEEVRPYSEPQNYEALGQLDQDAQWLQRHPEAGSSWPSWSMGSQETDTRSPPLPETKSETLWVDTTKEEASPYPELFFYYSPA
jgi:hypothetical protein